MLFLSTILKDSPSLNTVLAPLDRWQTVAAFAGLLTHPECHANTVRLEVLVHLAVALCKGKDPVSRESLAEWLKTHFQKVALAWYEDPPEDVFISNVVEATGNHRIFEGIWERNDYWLQSLLRACRRLPEKRQYAEMLQCVGALLDLSEALAARNNLERYCEGGGEPKGPIHVPAAPEFAKCVRNVEFTFSELAELSIDPAHLAPFVWRDKAPEKLVNARFENTPLERRPILQRDGSLLVSLPTAVSIACRRFILETVNKHGDLLILDAAISSSQGHIGQKVLSRLEGMPWNPGDFPKPPSRGLVSLTFVPFQFDSDKYGVLTLVQPPLHTALSQGFSKTQDYSFKCDKINEDLRQIADHVAAAPGFKNGLFLFVIGGVGMPLAMPPPTLSEAWHIVTYSAPNFEMMALAENADLAMVWRLACQQARAEKRGVEIMNPNGAFNLFATWQQNGYSLIPLEAPTDRPGLLYAPPVNALLELRQGIRRAFDWHAVLRKDPDCYLEVERKNAYAWFKVVREAPFYVCLGSRAEIEGVIESRNACWWIIAENKTKSARGFSAVFQLWDCIAHWLIPVTAELSRIYAPMDTVTEFRLRFDDADSWSNKVDERQAPEADLKWKKTKPGCAEVLLTEEFFRSFMQPENKAERVIVAGLLQTGADLLDKVLPVEEVSRLTDCLLPAGSARHFHVVPGHDATLAAYEGPADSFSLRADVVSDVTQELGAAIAPDRRGKRTEDPEEIRLLVRAAVAHLKDQISTRLKNWGLRDTILRCFEALDHAHRDYHRWKVSAAALLQLHSDKAEVLGEARRRENDRAGATAAARVLIEFALFSCPSVEGDKMPESDLQELLASCQTLIALADYDLPKRAGFPSGWARIAPNGTFQIRNEYIEKLRQDYLQSTFDRGYFTAAEEYQKRFTGRSVQPLPPDFAEFDAALHDEIGLTAVEAIDVGNVLHKWGMNDGRSVWIMRRNELARNLADELEIPSQRILVGLMALRIFPRSAWNQELPVGCDLKDTFPWRFKRRFSLLRRPFIEITKDEDPLVVVSPLLIRDALRYLIENAYGGEFPSEFFATERMKRWHQEAIKRRSRMFVTRLADMMREVGFETRQSLKMRDLGAPDKLGDIDVLAWRSLPRKEIWVLECKALRNARSTEEVLDQLDEFRGEAGDQRDRHTKRMHWLLDNSGALVKITGFLGDQLGGKIITSHQVPMQFLPDAKAREFFVDGDSWREDLTARRV